MATVIKTTARLDEDEAALVARLKDPGTDEAEALKEITGLSDLTNAPAATVVHALVEAGITAVQEKAEEVGLSRLSAFLKQDPEHLAWVASRRKRASRRYHGGLV